MASGSVVVEFGSCCGVQAARVACGGGYMTWFVGDEVAGCTHCRC